MPAESKGTLVTAHEVGHPEEAEAEVIIDDYCLTVDGTCVLDSVQVYPGTGTHVLVIKGVRRR